MDLSLKLVYERVSQLTDKVNRMVDRSKKIHELPNLENSSSTELFIAVSDGENTGKKEFSSVIKAVETLESQEGDPLQVYLSNQE